MEVRNLERQLALLETNHTLMTCYSLKRHWPLCFWSGLVRTFQGGQPKLTSW